MDPVTLGMAKADAAKKYGQRGISIPTGWGLDWRSAKAEAAARRVNVVAWGDSLTHGIGSSNHRTKSWFGKLCTDLQTLYGDGGSGFTSACQSTKWTVGQTGDRVLCIFTGTWTILYAGLNDSSCFSSTIGDTATFTGIRGTTVRYHYMTHPTYGIVEVRIDGTLVDTLNTNAAQGVAFKDYAVTAGDHTVVITVASAVNCFVVGVSGLNATGIVPWNMGHGGRTTSSWLRTAGFAAGQNNATGSIRDQSPDLFLCEGIVNDPHTAGAGYEPATYAYNIRGTLDAAKAYDTATDCMIVLPHIGTWEVLDPAGTGVYKWQDMAARLRGLADTRGDAYVDFWTLGRASWSYWNSLGYWGEPGYSGASGADQVHMSDSGNAFVADTILPLLVAA